MKPPSLSLRPGLRHHGDAEYGAAEVAAGLVDLAVNVRHVGAGLARPSR